jgi:uncharacterized membrane protein
VPENARVRGRRPPPHGWGMTIAFAVSLVVAVVFASAIQYAYGRIGIGQNAVFALLALSLLGGLVDIPLARLPAGQHVEYVQQRAWGLTRVYPVVVRDPPTIIAVNVGGAIVPTAVSLYLAVHNPLDWRAVAAVAVVALVVHRVARPIRGLGIVVPPLVAPVASAAIALILGGPFPAADAYVGGSIGTLVGADLANLGSLPKIGGGALSIGGAGTFDSVFLSGIAAVLLVSL